MFRPGLFGSEVARVLGGGLVPGIFFSSPQSCRKHLFYMGLSTLHMISVCVCVT